MFSLKMKAIVIIISLFFLQGQSKALDWTTGDYNIPNPEWHGEATVNTYNNVTVKIFSDGVVHFNMYDNSELMMYGGGIGVLNLYPNSTASLFGGSIQNLWIEPSSSGWIKIYAHIESIDPQPDSMGRIAIRGTWLDDSQYYFSINLINGLETINHIQFIPEPATLGLLGLGVLALRQRKR